MDIGGVIALSLVGLLVNCFALYVVIRLAVAGGIRDSRKRLYVGPNPSEEPQR